MAKHRKKTQQQEHPVPETVKIPPTDVVGSPRSFLAGLPKSTLIALSVILLLGALLRFAHLAEIRTDPDYDMPMADAAFKHFWARAILTGDATPPPGSADPQLNSTPYVRPPAYPFFLAAVYLVTGTSFTAVRLIQIILGLISCLLLYRLGRRAFSEPVALLAAFFMSTYWIFIFFEGELNEPALTVFLLLAFMNLAMDWSRDPGVRRAALMGAILGVLALMRSEIILFYPLVLLWAVWRCAGRPLTERLWRAAVIPAVILLCIAPVTLRNYLASGEFVPISTIGGLNLYAGNNPQATGYFPNLDYRELFGVSTTLTHMNFPQLVNALERKTGQENLGHADLQRFFVQEALKYMRENPLDTLATAMKKVLYYWGPSEISSNKIVAMEKKSSLVLRYLPPYFVFLSLAAVGVAMLLLGKRAGVQSPDRLTAGGVLSLIALFVAVSFLTHVLFFVVARFRVPIIPFVLLFAAFSTYQFYLLAQSRNYYWLLRWGAALAAALVLFGVPWIPYDPNPVAYHYQRGLAFGHRGQADKAIEEFKQALNAGVLAGEPESVPVCSEMGYALSVQGDHYDAIFWYDKAIALDPGHALSHFRKGEALLAIDKFTEAVDSFETALRHDFGLAPAHLALARAYLRRGRFAEAEAAGKRAVEAVPGNIHLELLMGELMAQQGRAADALPYFQRAVEIDPDDARAYNYLGLQYAALGSYDEAIASYEKAINIDPGSSIARTNLGNLYAHRGQLDHALAHYRDALHADILDAGAEYGWGYVNAQRGETDRAILRFKNAIAKNPEYTEAHNYLGFLLLQSGQLDDARFHLERAVRLNPQFILARNNLGDLYVRIGLNEQAREQYQAVLDLQPGDPYAAEQLAKLSAAQPESGRRVITLPPGS